MEAVAAFTAASPWTIGAFALQSGLSIIQGNQRAEIEETNAEYAAIRAEEQAVAVEAEEAITTAERFRQIRAQIGVNRTIAAGQGLSLRGTPEQIIDESLANIAKDNQRTRVAANFQSQRLERDAKFSRQSGDFAAGAHRVGGYAGALGSLFDFVQRDIDRGQVPKPAGIPVIVGPVPD